LLILETMHDFNIVNTFVFPVYIHSSQLLRGDFLGWPDGTRWSASGDGGERIAASCVAPAMVDGSPGAATGKTVAKQLASSAVTLAKCAAVRTDSADRRPDLAAERTYAAWVRTGVSALASGVALVGIQVK